ncbi:MAG: 2-oxo-4-hydroxy-4-carboxy-5-ureidoimidazoline decarboxylase [Lapillicoccus sp.]
MAAAPRAGVGLETFNGWARDQAVALTRPCLDVDRWVAEVVDGRPYADHTVLLDTARQAAAPLTTEEIEAALAHHPRIGQSAVGTSREAQLSHAEQSGLQVDDDLDQRLRQGNADYERRFGRIFLIRAAGRSGPEILAELESRLGHDDTTEDRVVGEQLAQIAVLRLSNLVVP